MSEAEFDALLDFAYSAKAGRAADRERGSLLSALFSSTAHTESEASREKATPCA